MADSSARRVEFKPNKQTKPNRRQRIVLDPHRVAWTGLEKNFAYSRNRHNFRYDDIFSFF